MEQELAAVLEGRPEFESAAEVFRAVTLEEDFPTFLTITAYTRYLVENREPVAA